MGPSVTSSLCTIPSLTVFVLLRPSISVHFYISIHRNASDSADLHPVRQGGSCPLTLRTSGPRVIVRMSIVPDLDGVSIMRVCRYFATPTTNKEDAQAAQEEKSRRGNGYFKLKNGKCRRLGYHGED